MWTPNLVATAFGDAPSKSMFEAAILSLVVNVFGMSKTLKRKFAIHSIQSKEDIVSEKESTKEKSIIFDDQTDQMDIDLDDSQVDLSNFDDIVRIKEPGANKEISDSMNKKVDVVDEPHKSTGLPKFRFQSKKNSLLEDSNVESEVVKKSRGARNKPTTSTTDVSISKVL